MLDKAVAEYLDKHKQQYLDQLFEFLRFASCANPDPDAKVDACQQAAQWLADFLKPRGFDVRVLKATSASGMSLAQRPNVIATRIEDPSLPTVLVYGHYDVQPAQPLELWQSDPFEPVIRNGAIYARGANDDKGQLFAHLMAVDAILATSRRLPVNLKFFLEGEEEVGSPDLEGFVAEHADDLRADAALISDSEFFAPGVPAITYSLRGLLYCEVTFQGPATDLHSGLHGGAVTNPVNALCKFIAGLHDKEGRVTIPGFYKHVAQLSDRERREWRCLPFDAKEYAHGLGVAKLGGGEKKYSIMERRWGRPTLDCNGIVGGYTGPGSKTIIPSKASAKISMRLVPGQDPDKILAAFRKVVARGTPAGITAKVDVFGKSSPVMLNRHSWAMTAAVGAYEEGFGAKPTFIRCGASVPVTELMQRVLGIDAVLMGFGLPDDGLHAPNEHFSLVQLWGGAKTASAMLTNLRDGYIPTA